MAKKRRLTPNAERLAACKETENQMAESMLSPYRVLDLADEKGAFCGKLLGDLGADVIKIERPGGDLSRNIGPFYHDIKDPEKSLFWFAYNTSKRGVTLDIETKEGQKTFKQLVKTADFLIESFPPGHMARLGLDYSALSQLNPRLIMASITPFGQTGPYKDYKASDIIVQALGGPMYITGDPDRAPLRCSSEQAYFQAGIQAAVGMMLAHHHRHITDKGQYIDVSMHESILPTLSEVVQEWDISRVIVKRQGQFAYQYKSQTIYPCKDGYVAWGIRVGAQGPRVRFLVDWMESQGMAGDLRDVNWQDIGYHQLTPEQMGKWQGTFAKFFLKYTKEELHEEAIKRGLMLFPVTTTADLLKNKQLGARNYWAMVQHDELNRSIVYPGAPFIASITPWRISRRAPLIGEHNEEVRRELAATKESRVRTTQVRMKQVAERKGAAEGIKIADFSWAGQATEATKYLANHGAMVVKMESMQHPDVSRIYYPYAGGVAGINRSGRFAMHNSSKYSIRLNLNDAKGIEIAKRLVTWSDIVVENFSPGTMRKWGLSYEDLKKVKANIIMASGSIQGQTGPHAAQVGAGVEAAALAGFTNLIGWHDRMPVGYSHPYTDFITPWYLVVAVLGALDYRNRTGKGQYIDITQFECGISFLAPAILDYTANNRLWSARGNRSDYAAPHGAYPCLGDDRWCTIAVSTDEEWKAFCKVIGQPEWTKDSRFATLSARKQNEDELDRLVGVYTAKHTAEQVMTMMQQSGVPAGVVANGKDLLEDPQLNHRHHFLMLDHPEMGVTAYETPPFRLSSTPAEIKRAPLMGEHTEYVCRELLGMSEKEFAALLNEGVFY